MLKNFCYGLAALITTTVMAAPSNDLCVNRQSITDGFYPFDTTGAGKEVDACPYDGVVYGTVDVWYEYTASTSRTIAIETFDLNYVQVAVYDSCLGTQLACKQDTTTDSGGSPLMFAAIQGQTYVIRVSTYHELDLDGPGTLVIAPPPSADLCTAAMPLMANTPTVFNTDGATNTPADVANTCLAGLAARNDVWFSYQATAPGTISVMVTPTSTNYSPNVSVYGSCGGSNLLACAASGSFSGSRVVLPVALNQTVYIRVGTEDNTARTGTIEITGPAAPPANDDCAGAVNIADGQTISVSNVFATASALPLGFNCSGSRYDLWYRFVAGQSGQVIFTTSGSSVSTRLAVFDDSCNNLTCGSVEELPNGLFGIAAASVASGSAIRVRLVSDGDIGGMMQLHAQFVPSPVNDLCENATNIGSGDTNFNTLGAATDGTTCVGFELGAPGNSTLSDVWYNYTPTLTGYADIGFASFSGGYPGLAVYGGCNSGEQLSCQSSRARVGITAGQAIRVRINVAAGDNVSGTFNIAEHTVGSTQYFEGNTDLAGDSIASAADLTGRNGLTQALGTLQVNDHADIYKIKICQPTMFSAAVATTDPFGKAPSRAAQLFLFNEQGQGVVSTNDLCTSSVDPVITGALVPSAGVYYLAVSGVYQPVNDNIEYMWTGGSNCYTNAPPVNGGTLSDWLVLSNTQQDFTQTYVLALTGLCSCPADFDGNSTVNVSDIFAFLRAWFAHNPSADTDGNTVVNVSDIFAFLRHWFAHC